MESFVLFEVSDKIVPLNVLYTIFITLGFVGFVAGFMRWWIGVAWLIVPNLLLTTAICLLQYGEIEYLYDHIIREQGRDYVHHNVLAPVSGVLINLLGVGFGLRRRFKSRLE